MSGRVHILNAPAADSPPGVVPDEATPFPMSAADRRHWTRAAAFMYFSYASTMTAAAVLPLIVARVLGVSALGLYSLLTLPYVGGQTLDAGLALGSLAAATQVTADDSKESRPFSVLQGACAPLGTAYAALGALGGCIVPFLLPHQALPGTLLLLTSAAAGALLVVTSPARAAAVASKHFDVLAASNTLSALTMLILGCASVPLWHWWGLALVILPSVCAGRLFLFVCINTRASLDMRTAFRPTLEGLRDVRGQLPALTISGTGQLVMIVDVIILSLLYNSGTVGAYRLGILIPTQIVAVLFLGADLSMPVLARARSDPAAAHSTVRVSVVLSLSSGLMLTAGAIEAPTLLHLFAGADVPYAVGFARIFCLSQALNSIIHLWAIFVFARGKQTAIAGLVHRETWANIALTVILAALLGPLGCGYATVAAVGISNIYFLPRILRSRLHVPGVVRSVVQSGLASAAGAACAALVAAVMAMWRLDGWSALAFEAVGTLSLGLVVLAAAKRHASKRRPALPTPRTGASC